MPKGEKVQRKCMYWGLSKKNPYFTSPLQQYQVLHLSLNPMMDSMSAGGHCQKLKPLDCWAHNQSSFGESLNWSASRQQY